MLKEAKNYISLTTTVRNHHPLSSLKHAINLPDNSVQ